MGHWPDDVPVPRRRKDLDKASPCRCGYPSDDTHDCPLPFGEQRDAEGKFINNVRKVAPKPSSHMNDLRSAMDNLLLSAQAFRDHGDWVMQDSMLAAQERISKAILGLINDKENS